MFAGVIAYALIFLSSLAGQSATATLSGTIADQTGAVVSDVKVIVVNTDTRLERVATTSTSGTFSLPLLPPGRYRLTAQRDGFAPIQSEVTLHAGDHVSLRLEFVVAPVGEAVTVTVPDRVIRSSERGLVVDREALEQLPLNGRSYHTLFLLAPGVTMVNQSNNAELFSVNGQRTTSNAFAVDGVSANVGADRLGQGQSQDGMGVAVGTTAVGGMNNLVPVEGLEEFRLTTNAYAPEFGRQSGGSVQITTRAGTNQLKGSVFEQFRDERFNANDWFANRMGSSKLEMSLHNFGAALGGPVVRDRWHYFAAYEGLRMTIPSFLISQVPSRALRASIPANARFLVDIYPQPTGPDQANGFAEAAYGVTSPSRSHSVSLRSDYMVSPRQQLFGRLGYSTSSAGQRGRNGGTTVNTTPVDSSDSISTTIGTTWVGQSFSYEARGNYTSHAASLDYVTDDFAGGAPLPDSLFPSYTSREQSSVQVDIPQLTGLLVWAGRIGGSTQRQVHVLNHLTWQQGDTTWKAGLDLRSLLPRMDPGDYTISYRVTSLDSLRRGQADQVNFTQNIAARPRFDTWSSYLQLQRPLGARANLMTGLRWDINPGPAIRGGVEPTLVEIDPSLSVRVRSGQSLWNTDYSNLAPRVAFNYALDQRAGRTTVLRAGAGMFFDVAYGRAGGAFGAGHPYLMRKSFTAVSLPINPTLLTPDTAPSAVPGTASVYSIPEDLKTPRSFQWTVGLDRQLGQVHHISTALVHTRNTRMLRSSLLNLAAINRDYQSIWVMTNEGESDYWGLQLQATRRLHRGVSAQLAYTLAETTDNGSSDFSVVPPSSIADPRSRVDIGNDTGPALFDVRHSLGAAITLQDRGRGEGMFKLLRGWELNILGIARSSPPVHIFVTRNLGFGSFQFRPDRVTGEALYADDASAPCGRRIRREAFAVPSELRQGTAPRNEARGCVARQIDLAIRRTIPLSSGRSVAFGLEIFNVANWPNFEAPVGNLNSTLFGAPFRLLASPGGTSTSGLNPFFQFGGPRSIQLSARFTF